MATLVLQAAGTALGTLFGGPIGGMIGRALGGLAGAVIDNEIFGTATHREGPRIASLKVMASEEGAAVPAVFGRMRVAGQVIWATNILEQSRTDDAGGKGGPSNTVTSYSYYGNFAVALCEGPIQGLGRCWADGKEIDLETLSPRIYLGSEDQLPDSLISTVEGADNAPAYRGLAYLVFERLPLANFGNRLPQFSLEVFAKGNEVAELVRAVNIIPGATEFGYDTALVTRNAGAGKTLSENTHVSATRSDWSVSLDQLQQACSNVGMASLVVAWFGNSLDCASCEVKPGVDRASKITSVAWGVDGMTRGTAHVVGSVDGAPAYGGTPSDASVIHAIQDLKARGLKVMFYPFLLMDCAGFPWRGRISSAHDKSAAAASDVSAFVNGTWGYRRMILHYANLCASAGGVDAFLLGSELRGLTTLRSDVGYPFVDALVALAAEVKAILPGAKISYGADWSEYFGHQPQDGSGDVYFHLDPLWSSPTIDFIGIDNYMPLSDWRDGDAGSIYEVNALQANIGGGEGFDWYYASEADRDAQVRTPISDWVFKYKDIKSWWANQHFNRPSGVAGATATAWVPQSKPIWFTEMGCPAVDKGTNQPNVFIDAKSDESALPYYSGGQQDTQIQLAYVEAMQSYWAAAGETNPVSSVYAAPMVDAARLFYWSWDARPYPAFPARDDIWSDAANYARGHWLNGRINAVALGTLIKQIAARFESSDVDVSGVEGLADGFVLDRPMSARDALEDLLNAYCIDCLESDGELKFVSRRTKSAVLLDAGDLIDDDKASPLIMRNRAQEADLPLAAHLGYAESGLDYRQAAVSQTRVGTISKAEVAISLPVALPQHQAQGLADVALAEAYAARETAQFVLPPSWERVEPGDVLALSGNLWRVKTIHAGTTLKIEAVAHDPAVYDPPPAPDRGVAAVLPAVYGAPQVVAMDLALAADDGAAGPRFAAQASPWPGALALYKEQGASLSFKQLLSAAASIGTTLTDLAAGQTARLYFAQTLDVQMLNGTLSAVSGEALRAGSNIIAIGTADSGYEILQFRDCVLLGADTYRLGGFLRAQAGSLPEMLSLRVAGQDVVVLDAAVVQPSLTVSEQSLPAMWRIGPQQRDPGDPSYVEVDTAGTLKALRPLSPVHLKLLREAGGYRLSWNRRTRVGGDSWEMAEVPLGEESESYRLDLINGGSVVRSVTLAAPTYLYATADVTADFGAVPATLMARVAQLSAAFGAGASLEGTLDV